MSQNTTTSFIESQISQTRTVFDILWSCLFAIFACTWTVQHLNVPLQRDEEEVPGWKGEMKYWLRNLWTSVKWMGITVLAPELLITLNMRQLIAATRTTKALKEFAKEDGVPWSLTHSLFANMGGFVVREYAPERVDELPSLQHPWSYGDGSRSDMMAHLMYKARKSAHEASYSATGTSTGNTEAQPHTKPKLSFLLAAEIMALRKHKVIRLPYITRDEILDKGKSDTLSRLLALVQTIWLVVQMIVRGTRHLETSQLEVGTVAFAMCAITIYALNWHKPKNVGVPWTLWSFAGPSFILEHLERISTSPVGGNGLLSGWLYFSSWKHWGLKSPHGSLKPMQRGAAIAMHHHHDTGFIENDNPMTGAITSITDEGLEFFFLLLSSAIFGAIHLVAVNFTFPTAIERVLWRAASAVTTGASVLVCVVCVLPLSLYCPIFVISYFCYSGRGEGLYQFPFLITKVLMRCIVILYILARLFIIVELFRTLFFLPPSALVATWVSSVPHVS